MHSHLKKPTHQLAMYLYCNGEKITQVKSFKYLGYTIAPNAKSDAEIKKRIVMVKETFRKMKPYLQTETLPSAPKLIHSKHISGQFFYTMCVLDTEYRYRKETGSC